MVVSVLTLLEIPENVPLLAKSAVRHSPECELLVIRSSDPGTFTHSSDSDLLKRHAAKHDSTEDASDGALPSTKRRKPLPDLNRPRAQRACQACADAKARCEGDRPCSRCQQKSIPCDYPPSRSNGTLDHPKVHQIVVSKIHDSQSAADSSISNEPQRLVQDSVTTTVAGSSRADVIDSLGRMGVQAANLQPPTPSKHGPGKFAINKDDFKKLTNHYQMAYRQEERTNMI